jgi:hypothetical protein
LVTKRLPGWLIAGMPGRLPVLSSRRSQRRNRLDPFYPDGWIGLVNSEPHDSMAVGDRSYRFKREIKLFHDWI